MVKRRVKSRRTGVIKKKVSRPKRQKWGTDLKSRILNLVIWTLALVNIVLIASLASRFFAPSREENVIIKAEEPIEVEVLNGCGVKGLAKEFTDYLRRYKEFDVVKCENYESFDIKETIVIDRTSMEKKDARKVAEALGVEDSKVVPQLNEERQLDVTVIIGKDYQSLKAYKELK